MSVTYAMVLTAQDTNLPSLFMVGFLAGQPMAPVAMTMTVQETVVASLVGASVASGVQVSAPPCTFELSFVVIPLNGNIAGTLQAIPVVQAAVTLKLIGRLGEVGSVTLRGGDPKITFAFDAPTDNAFTDGGESFIAGRRGAGEA